jgi:hypothetical protein
MRPGGQDDIDTARDDAHVGTLRGRTLLLALVLAAAALLVLRAPLDVLALVTRTSPPLAETDQASLAIVGDDVTGQRDVAVGVAASTGPGGTEGRWGTPASRPTTELVLQELRGGWRVESGVEEAAALAVVAAHAWIDARSTGDTARRGALGAGAGGAIVIVEAIERPGSQHGVVTLVVASGDALHRLAVPVTFGAAGAAIAGAPWPLPAPRLENQPLESTPIGDEELLVAARRAIASIGIDEERMIALEVTDGWPFIARLDDDTDGHPWLRWHVDRFVVAGLPLDAVREE